MALNARQQTFVDEYLRCMNASEAARAAGYSEKTAYSIGDELLKKPEVAEAIARGRKERAERTQISADRVLLELARVAFADIGKAINEDGTLKPVHEIAEDTRRAIASIDNTNNGRRVRLNDKLKALDLIGRHLGLFDARLTLKGDPENPLTALLMRVQGSSIPVVHKEHEGE